MDRVPALRPRLLVRAADHGSRTSSQFTEFVGWGYNVLNGVGFAVAFALLGFRRGWAWAIPFALLLETMTVVTPYADIYGLRGQWDVIAIAYGPTQPTPKATRLKTTVRGSWWRRY